MSDELAWVHAVCMILVILLLGAEESDVRSVDSKWPGHWGTGL